MGHYSMNVFFLACYLIQLSSVDPEIDGRVSDLKAIGNKVLEIKENEYFLQESMTVENLDATKDTLDFSLIFQLINQLWYEIIMMKFDQEAFIQLYKPKLANLFGPFATVQFQFLWCYEYW